MAVIKSVCLEICWQKLGKGKYTGRFSDSHQICQSGNLLEEMGEESTGRLSDCHHICQSGNLLTESGWGESTGRLSDCHQICQSGKLLADFG